MEGVAVHHCQDCFGQQKHFLKVVKEQEYMCILQIVAQYQNTNASSASCHQQLLRLPKPELLI